MSETGQKTGGRILWLDKAKGFAMLCVVAGHMGNHVIDSLVFPFHVPLFFLLSGYFLSTREDFRTYARKKARQLWIPYLFTALVLVLFSYLSSALLSRWFPPFRMDLLSALYGSATSRNHTPPGILPVHGPTWYLEAVFWATLLVRAVLGKKHAPLILVTVAAVSYCTSWHFWLPLNLQAGGTAALYVYLGAEFRRRGRPFQCQPLLLLAGLAAWCFMFQKNIRVSIASNSYDMVAFSFAGSILVSYAVLCLSQGLDAVPGRLLHPVQRFLRFFGRNTDIVLCFHTLEFNLVPWDWVMDHFPVSGMAHTGILFVLKILVLCLSIWVVHALPPLRAVFSRQPAAKGGSRRLPDGAGTAE